jgi:hypothetical protein
MTATTRKASTHHIKMTTGIASYSGRWWWGGSVDVTVLQVSFRFQAHVASTLVTHCSLANKVDTSNFRDPHLARKPDRFPLPSFTEQSEPCAWQF